MSGRVQAIKNYGKENEIILGELNRGDIIGDMALITEERRSATIKSSKLTRLIYFSKETFNSVMHNNPKALMEVSKALINRLKYKDSNTKDNNLAIIIIDLLLYFVTKLPANPPSKDQGNDQVTFANVTFNGESVNSYIIIIIRGI